MGQLRVGKDEEMTVLHCSNPDQSGIRRDPTNSFTASTIVLDGTNTTTLIQLSRRPTD